MSKPKTAISPIREDDFPEWYQQVVRAADLAENSEVRGCMVIKPWGFGIWENLQRQLDVIIKRTGHENAYFPLLIPLSYLEKEASHVEGFATECAVVTHHRLEVEDGKMVPAGELTEPYVIRPTSETIIGAAFARWVESYRDLPLLINQWANVMRWEMRPRLFLRTAEFLWQEGHTAHATAEEALAETQKMHQVYVDFLRHHLAIPVFAGEKSERERFPGAVATYTVEAMVQDRKAIQAGTSHFLGQNFAKAAGIEFASPEGGKEHVWMTSWGVSTRLIGTLIMAHSDDDGLIIPPRVAPAHIVIIPVTPKEDTRDAIIEACDALAETLRHHEAFGEEIRVRVDKRDIGGGTKQWEWIKKGVPIRVEIGPRDLENRKVAVCRRDRGPKEKEFIGKEEFLREVGATLESIQDGLLQRAEAFLHEHTKDFQSQDEMIAFFTPENSEKPGIHGGFARVAWAGSSEEEERLQKDHKITLRCLLPIAEGDQEAACVSSGAMTSQRAIFAKSY